MKSCLQYRKTIAPLFKIATCSHTRLKNNLMSLIPFSLELQKHAFAVYQQEPLIAGANDRRRLI